MLLHSLYCYQESSHTADTLLLSRVHHVGSIADCARKPGARSSVYYRALPRTVDGGSPGARGHTCKYNYIYIRHPRSHTARLLASLRSATSARGVAGCGRVSCTLYTVLYACSRAAALQETKLDIRHPGS